MQPLTEAALRLNVPVFPCGADKAPIVAGGFKSATRDPAIIRQWFADPRAAMIGVPTGPASGVLAVDVDVHGQTSGMPWWESNKQHLPNTRRHATRSGGLHLIFRIPGGKPIRNSASRIAPGVDVRGDGGYIIVPPSPGYRVEVPHPIADMPPWLATLCHVRKPPPIPPPSYVPDDTAAWRRVLTAAAKISMAGEGARNATLNAQAYYVAGMVGHGIDEASAVAAMFQAARQAGLTEHEIKATLHSAFSAGMRR